MSKLLPVSRALLPGLFFLLLINPLWLNAQVTQVGAGSYTTVFPGVDEAGRNGFPGVTPQLSGEAAEKPVPTNDWWSALLTNDHVSNLFNYPLALKTTNQGLVASYIPWGVYDDQEPIIIGVTDLNASKATVSNHSDWTVTVDFNDDSHQVEAMIGVGMPFVYFTKASGDQARVIINLGEVTVTDEMIVVTDARNGADFAIYAPVGSSWTQEGNTYTSDLNGKDYWSMAMLPQENEDVNGVAEEYKAYAYVFPTNTVTSWDYDETTGIVKTDFHVETQIKEGDGTQVLMGLLPHQWGNLAASSSSPQGYSYTSVRGELKMLAGNSFSVENTFRGILPTLPYLSNYSEGFNPAELESKVQALENEGLSTWTDSYNEGQVMNRLIQTARIAEQMGNTVALNKIIATIKERLEDWLTYEASEVAFLFYYNSDWTALLGYPAGHGQDNNINDHHFHWGYFIHAAAFMEQYEPGWADEWGDMVNHLVRDASSWNRNDELFPFLRNFSPYSGHCWANGTASFPQGNDQESTSESMQFHSSLIHWGTITGNDEIRDMGIYLYTTEQTAVEEYWFDVHNRVFSDNQNFTMVSRVWGNSYDNQTFWTADITASYVIEMYPIHGGSLYLGHQPDYIQKVWDEMKTTTGILNTEDENPNLWHDVIWKYLSFIDPEEAISLYNDHPNRTLKFGVSDAQTYHWLHSINAMGQLRIDLTADYPIAAAFEKDGEVTYVAHNYGNDPIKVTFSDGFELEVPAREMATNRDLAVSGVMASNFTQALAGGAVDLTVAVEGEGITKVEFIDGTTLLGEKTEAPFTIKADDLSLGIHGFYAKVYVGDAFIVTNSVQVQVGEQQPFSGTPHQLPGTIEAGHYDVYEGGQGQGISYLDFSSTNQGNYRTDEIVDAESNTNEGATLGWIAPGEWVEYTIEVEEAGLFEMSFRYASDNGGSRGPFHLELNGNDITDEIEVPFTNGWNTWATKIVEDIPFPRGKHVLRLFFDGGEFNLAKMTFTRTSALPYSQPEAKAGPDLFVELPDVVATLDASKSTDPAGQALTYTWTQVFGPSEVVFEDANAAITQVSGLEEGTYLISLEVSNGNYSDQDELYIIVDDDDIIAPLVSMTAPEDQLDFIVGQEITFIAAASDQDGSITEVAFFLDNTSIATVTEEPYSTTWTAQLGEYTVHAVATDDGGNKTTSEPIKIKVIQEPPCRAEVNDDFSYEFSDAAENPTLTFIPAEEGIGDAKCVLYYSTSPNTPFQSFNVTPNEAFNIQAEEGSRLYFYYDYSVPGEEDRNSFGNILSYIVGTCQAVPPPAELTVNDQDAGIPENSPVGSVAGRVIVSYTGTETLTFNITSGNTGNTFTIASDGIITVANNELLDFETMPTFTLDVTVTDGTVSDDAIITVEVRDVDDDPTISVEDQTFRIDENSETGTLVGVLQVEYDGDGSLSYAISSSSNRDAFNINAVDGRITVGSSELLDFETTPTFTMEIVVTDGVVTDEATVTINLNNKVELIVGLDDALEVGLKGYPNPVRDILKVDLLSGEIVEVKHIYNAQGKEQVLPFSREADVLSIDFSGTNPGVYLILMEKQGKRYYMKVLKE